MNTLKNYFLANEVTERLGISIANISSPNLLYRKDDENVWVKRGNCIFNSLYNIDHLSKNTQSFIRNNELMDCSKLIPVSYLVQELKTNELNLQIFGKIEFKYGKKLLFLNSFGDKIFNKKINDVLPIEDCKELKNSGDIEDYIPLNKKDALYYY